MSDLLQNLLGLGAIKINPFPANSRYSTVPTAMMQTADGRKIVYLRRRFLPPAQRFSLMHEYDVVQGDRPDTISARLIGDPELFWRLCDANGVMRPDELTEKPGRTIRVTLPEGIPGGLGD